MNVRILGAAAALALLAGCKPSADDIEFALIARGLSDEQAACVASGLEPLEPRDWLLLAEVVGDAGRSPEEWQDMSLGELQGKLLRLQDTYLLGVLLRTGLGCAVMHGGLGEQPV